MDPRTAVRTNLVTQLRIQPALTGVQVEYGWPGDERQDECICLGPVTGQLEVPVFHGPPDEDNPATYDDKFSFPIWLGACTEGQTSDDAELRGRFLWTAILWVARTSPTLDVVEVIDADLTDVNDETPATTEGFVFFATATFNVHARHIGPPS